MRLRGDESSRRIPVVVLTAKSLTQAERDRLNSDADRIVGKGGYDQNELLRDIRELVALRTGRSMENET